MDNMCTFAVSNITQSGTAALRKGGILVPLHSLYTRIGCGTPLWTLNGATALRECRTKGQTAPSYPRIGCGTPLWLLNGTTALSECSTKGKTAPFLYAVVTTNQSVMSNAEKKSLAPTINERGRSGYARVKVSPQRKGLSPRLQDYVKAFELMLREELSGYCNARPRLLSRLEAIDAYYRQMQKNN